MEITVRKLIDIANHLEHESKKYRHGLAERIHREGDIKFYIHDYESTLVSRGIPKNAPAMECKLGMVILKGGEPVFVIE